MADDVLITPGTGARIAADELTIGGQSVKVQRTKQAAGEDGVYIGDVGGALVDGHANRSALFVRERTDARDFVITVTVNTAAYVADNCLGGKLTIANVVAAAGNVFRLNRIFAVSKIDPGALTAYLFSADPSSTTITDHAAFPTIDDADIAKLAWLYSLNAVNDGTHYTASASRPNTDATPDIALTGTSLYLALRTAGTPDFVTANDFKLVLSGERL